MANYPNFDQLIQEAQTLSFSGWDFSVIGDRWKTSEPSWDYPHLARTHMRGI
jgi:hypothetical protein